MGKHTDSQTGASNGIDFFEGNKVFIDGEHYVPFHCFSYIISGMLTLSDGAGMKTFKKGQLVFSAGKRLAKLKKSPEPDGLFKAISIVLNEELLQNFRENYQVPEKTGRVENTVFSLESNFLWENYTGSLLPYFDTELPENLALLKRNECIILLVNEHPEFANILFNFSAPGKIDLEEFMNKNFKYNTRIRSYAYLTGRSLASFKRDFQKVFHTSPNRWLQKKRLEEAYYLIKEKGQKPSEVYLEVGFETLSHFSYSFKQFFGVNPSNVK